MKPRSNADFALFYAQHAALVRRVLDGHGVRPADLDDVVQDAFVTIHRLLPSFEGRARPETWLRAIAWRVAAGYHRHRRMRPHVGVSGEQIAAAPTSVDTADLPAALGAIDAKQRDLLALHEIGGMPISMLSELTGHARATIRQRLQRARSIFGQREAVSSPDLSGQLEHVWPQREAQDAASVNTGAFRVLSCGAACISQLDDIVIGVWPGQSTVESMHALGDAFANALAERPERSIRYLAIVEPTSTPPRFEARQVQVALTRNFGPRVRAAAAVVEANAMMPLVSGILNAYFALARTAVHMRFFSDLPSALEWFVPYGTTENERVTARVAAMRAELRARGL